MKVDLRGLGKELARLARAGQASRLLATLKCVDVEELGRLAALGEMAESRASLRGEDEDMPAPHGFHCDGLSPKHFDEARNALRDSIKRAAGEATRTWPAEDAEFFLWRLSGSHTTDSIADKFRELGLVLHVVASRASATSDT